MLTRRVPLAITAAGIALLGACGGDDANTADADGGTRTIEIDMVDIAFEPEAIEVQRGERVRFVFHNRGEVAHDAFIGDAEEQAAHEADMRDAGDDDADHGGHGDDADAESAVTVEPGESAELTYTFVDAGTIEIGCHQPGHYDAGMKVTVDVA